MPHEEMFTLTVEALYNEDGEPIDCAPHPMMTVRVPYDRPLPLGCYLRRQSDD